MQQVSPLSPISFALVIDRLTYEVRQESPSTIMVVDVIVIGGEIESQVQQCGYME